MKLRVLIVDDERIARERLARFLTAEPEVEIVGECADGETAIRLVQETRPDVMLLDIEMPGLKGFDVIESLDADQALQVIFVTAYDEHAVRAFELCALDYLLKPTSAARLSKALTRAREQIALRSRSRPELSISDSAHRKFKVTSAGRISFVSVADVDWVEAAGNYAILHAGPAGHMVRETMSTLESQLPQAMFLRVSRSAIVNLCQIQSLTTSAAGENAAILKDGQKVQITRSLREVAGRLIAL